MIWKFDNFEGDVIELYELVIPEEDRVNEESLLNNNNNNYKLLTVRDEQGKLEALAIVCLITGYINPLTSVESVDFGTSSTPGTRVGS